MPPKVPRKKKPVEEEEEKEEVKEEVANDGTLEEFPKCAAKPVIELKRRGRPPLSADVKIKKALEAINNLDSNFQRAKKRERQIVHKSLPAAVARVATLENELDKVRALIAEHEQKNAELNKSENEEDEEKEEKEEK